MFTAIIHREEYESWRCGERETQSPSRMEIVFDPGLFGLKEKLLKVAKSFEEDCILSDADLPEYNFLYNGIPQRELESEELAIEGAEQISDALWSLEKSIKEEIFTYAQVFRKQLAIKANEERLERERKEKAVQRERDLQQLRLLNAKYGKDI